MPKHSDYHRLSTKVPVTMPRKSGGTGQCSSPAVTLIVPYYMQTLDKLLQSVKVIFYVAVKVLDKNIFIFV